MLKIQTVELSTTNVTHPTSLHHPTTQVFKVPVGRIPKSNSIPELLGGVQTTKGA